MNSMLFNFTGSNSSHDYIGDESRVILAEEVAKIDPFSKDRAKITLFDKSMGSPYSGLNKSKVESFVKRNKSNFMRKFYAKLL